MFLYIVTNLINGKMYVGKTVHSVEARWRDHLKCAVRGDQQYFYRAIRKYGSENFEVRGLGVDCSDKELQDLECRAIAFLGSRDQRIGYNQTEGGDGAKGYKHTLETREHLRKSARGKMRGSAYRQNISKAKTGTNNPMYGRIGEKNPFHGKKQTEEAKLRTGEASKLRWQSEDFRQRNLAARSDRFGAKNTFYGKRHSEEAKQKMREAKSRRKLVIKN